MSVAECGAGGVVPLRVAGEGGGIGWVKDPFGCDAPAPLECSLTADLEAARCTVAARATDARDLSLLLDMLGLLPPEPGPVSRPPGRKADSHG